jgi:hypothetical protein
MPSLLAFDVISFLPAPALLLLVMICFVLIGPLVIICFVLMGRIGVLTVVSILEGVLAMRRHCVIYDNMSRSKVGNQNYPTILMVANLCLTTGNL